MRSTRHAGRAFRPRKENPVSGDDQARGAREREGEMVIDNRLGPLNDDTPPLGESSQNIQEEQPEPRHRKRSVLLRILSALFRITVVVLVLGSLVIVFSVSVLPRITGAQALIVLSGSMEPALPVGSVVIAGPVEPHEIDVGDIITFTHADPAQTEVANTTTLPLVTHRVIDIETTEEGIVFHTQGDANTVPDEPPVPAADVRGKVWYHIPYFGYAQQAMVQGPTALYVLAGLLFVFGIWLLSVALSDDEPPAENTQQSPQPVGEGGDGN